MSVGTLHESTGHGDEDFNWEWAEGQMSERDTDVGMSRGGIEYMLGREVGAQRLGRVGLGGFGPGAGESLRHMALDEAAQRLAQMGLNNY